MMVPLGILQFSAFFSRIYAWWMTATPQRPALNLFGWSVSRPLEPGVVTCLYVGVRLYMFPLGILAISVATAVFPLLSRYAARGDVAGLREATNRALRLSLFLGVPSGVALIILARPSIALIYRHGRFDDVARAARILQMYCLGMWAYFANHILLRAFYSQKDTRTPLKVSCALAAANMLAVVFLVFTPLRGAAIGLATAVSTSATVAILAWVLHRRWGRLGLRQIIRSLARTAAATAAMAAAVLATWALLRRPAQQLAQAADTRWLAPGVVAGACIVLGGAVFLAAAAVLRCPELRELRRRPLAPVQPPPPARYNGTGEAEGDDDA
jgi:putative peptidoglycan lipid II flippase